MTINHHTLSPNINQHIRGGSLKHISNKGGLHCEEGPCACVGLRSAPLHRCCLIKLIQERLNKQQHIVDGCRDAAAQGLDLMNCWTKMEVYSKSK